MAADSVTILSNTDYYPFGMEMPGRKLNSSDYDFGFNGMEKDDEVKGEGNSYTTHFRQYDPRIARWSSIDPKFTSFPWQSPYVAFDNDPINKVDPRGDAAGDPKKLTEAAEAGAKASKDYKEKHKVSSACNIATRCAVKNYTGKDLLSPENVGDGTDKKDYKGQANDIAQAFADNKIEDFEELDVEGDYSELQRRANNGELIVGVTDNSSSGKSGHVVVFVPGKEGKGKSWRGGGDMPQVMDGGMAGDYSQTPLTTVSGQGTVKKMKFYVYKPSIKKTNSSDVKQQSQASGSSWKPNYEGERATQKNSYWGRGGALGGLKLYRK